MTREEDLKASSRVPYRLLEEAPELGYGDPSAGNMLIQGDNLEALKALLPFYAGQVKCIFIDPPYNTRSAFEHYDDNLEHAQWLGMMYPRLELLRDLLREDGSIWVTIDDNEGHYLKVVMDEVFGRGNFVANIVWQKRTSRENRAAIGSSHDDILLYAKMPAVEWKQYRNTFPARDSGFANPDHDPKGEWRPIPFTAQGFRAAQMYAITLPSGRVVKPPRGRCWGATRPTFDSYLAQGQVYFGKSGDAQPTIKKYRGEEAGLVPMTWWPAEEFGDNTQSKREILELFDEDSPFGTPKPEQLLQKILTVGSLAGDLVLDSFAGSGTTAAVAQKMNRRYIGIELGEHAVTHCVPRLRKVVDGEQGGISKAVGWTGGGGFRFYRLGKPVFDAEGRIDAGIRFEHLAAHIWFSETRTALPKPKRSPLLGVDRGTAYFLLYNGVLGDKRPRGGNVLTRAVLEELRALLPDGFAGPWVVYGESSRLSAASLKREGIVMKQTPYDVRSR